MSGTSSLQISGDSVISVPHTHDETSSKHGTWQSSFDARVDMPSAPLTPTAWSSTPQKPQIVPIDANTYRQSGVSPIQPQALRVHPRGFKVLATESPLERNLHSYFRLPPLPNPRLQEEHHHVERMAQLVCTDQQQPAVLDGFLMLTAANVVDPADAVEAIIGDLNLTSAVADDLAFFHNLEFLDAGENRMALEQLVPLVGLQELHLHCNLLSEVRCPAAAFQSLHTLNVSYNQLTYTIFFELAKLPALQRLDLSFNCITSLPSDLSEFKSLTQLALEGNGIYHEDAFHALGTIGSLLEVNLNSNRLQRVPRPHHDAAPNLEVLGIACNEFEYFEDLYPVTEYPNLRRVVLWGNRIQHRKTDLARLQQELQQLDISIVLEGPLPPKKKPSAFYAMNRSKLVKVPGWHKWIQKPGGSRKVPDHSSTVDDSAPDHNSSFFITGTDVPDDITGVAKPRNKMFEVRSWNSGATEEVGEVGCNEARSCFSGTSGTEALRHATALALKDRTGAGGTSGTEASTGHDSAPSVLLRAPKGYQGRIARRAPLRPHNVRGAIHELKGILQHNAMMPTGRRPSFLPQQLSNPEQSPVDSTL